MHRKKLLEVHVAKHYSVVDTGITPGFNGIFSLCFPKCQFKYVQLL